MEIGEKIKRLRSAKLMTQAELAGDHITRNMLSCIENGVARGLDSKFNRMQWAGEEYLLACLSDKRSKG